MTKRRVIEDSDDDDEEEDKRQPSPRRAVSVFTDARPNHAGGFQSTDSIEAGTAGTAFNGKTASAERSRSSQEPQPSPSMSRKKMQRALSSGCAFGAAIVGTDTVNAFSSQGLVGGGSPNSVQQTLMPSYANGSTQALHTPSRGRSGGDDVFPEDPIQVNLRSSAIAALQSLPQSGSRHELSSSASSVLRKKDVMGKRDPREQPHPQWEDMEDELSRTSPMPHPTAPINPIVLLPRRANDDMANVSSKRIESPVEDVHHDLGSDDTSIGMPKEQYRPRASRSRAGLDNSELLVPVDFSKQPETVAKTTVKPRRKKKRCRTTSFEELRPPKDADDGTEEDTMVGDQALEIPIWTDNPLEPQPNAKVEDDENTKTVTAECQKPTQMEEAIQQPKKQRGRPKKVKAVEVGEPATKTPEAVEESLIESTELVTGSAATKTSKTATAVELRTEIEDNRNGRGTQNESNNRHNLGDEDVAGQKVFEESTGNVSKQSSPPTKIIGLPNTPKKPVEAPGKGPDKHSPIGSGKVGYRVGLSKRARIEPLLRMVRK